MSDYKLIAAQHLHKERGFKYVSHLGKGSYGSVIQMHSREHGMIAVKIVPTNLVNRLEVSEWKYFDNKNILKLLLIDPTLSFCIVFVTDLMKSTLTQHIGDKAFRDGLDATVRSKGYLRQVLSGLEYIHHRRFCHLDLRTDNIFIAFDGRAVIADFSGLCKANEKKNFCPLPMCFRPPEMLKDKKKVWPRPIDLWSYGMLAANVFFGKKFYEITVENANRGTILAVMDYLNVFCSVEEGHAMINYHYPNCKTSLNFAEQLVNFVEQFLKVQPKKRCSVAEGLSHSFLALDDKTMIVGNVQLENQQPSCSGSNIYASESEESISKISDGDSDVSNELFVVGIRIDKISKNVPCNAPSIIIPSHESLPSSSPFSENSSNPKIAAVHYKVKTNKLLLKTSKELQDQEQLHSVQIPTFTSMKKLHDSSSQGFIVTNPENVFPIEKHSVLNGNNEVGPSMTKKWKMFKARVRKHFSNKRLKKRRNNK